MERAWGGRGRGMRSGGFDGRRGGSRGGGGGRFGGRFSGDRPQRPTNPTKLHVTNLPEGCSKEELEELFDTFGKVVECDIVRDFAFVHFRSQDEAEKAVQNLNNYSWKGTNLVVRNSTSSLRQKPGASMGDCFRCGGRGHRSSDCPSELSKFDRRGQRSAPYPSPYPRDPYASRDPYFDPYERFARDPYFRRPLPVDPYLRDSLRDPYARDPYARDYLDPYSRISRDPYARPPPEFYQRGRGRGGKLADNGLGTSDMPLLGETGAATLDGLMKAARPAYGEKDPYFFNDDFEKAGFHA